MPDLVDAVVEDDRWQAAGIVPVAEAVPIVALPGTDRLTTNVLSGVSMLLPTMATSIVCVVVPAANVNVPAFVV